MTRKKIHIDELFRNGLKNLSFFVSNKDMEAIDDKKSQFENSPDEIKNTSFSGFELEVTENDWISTKNKLDIEKAAMAQDTVFSKSFDEFELEVYPEDWTETYRRYLNRKKRRTFFVWMGTGIVLLLIGLSVLVMNTLNSDSNENELAVNSTSQIENSEDKNISTEQNKTPDAIENTNSSKGNTNTSVNETTVADNKKSSNSQNNTANNSANSTDLKQSDKFESSNNNKEIESKPKTSNKNGFDNTEEPTKFADNTDVNKTFEISSTKKSDNSNKVTESEPTTEKGSNTNEQPNSTVDNSSGKTETQVSLSDNNKNTDNQKINPIDTPDTQNKNDVKIPPSPPKIGLYVGLINRIASTHRVLGNQNDSRYNAIRNGGEKPIFEWSKGIDIGIQKSGFLFNTGAQVSTQTWVTNYKYNYKVYDSLAVMQNGQIIGWFLFNPKDTFINEMNEVRIEKINIPIEINRIVKLNKNTNLIAGAGMMFGWNTKISGTKLLNPLNLQLYHYNRLKENERTFNMSPSLTLGIQNTIYKNFKIQTAFYGNMSMYSRFKDGFNVQDNPYTLGINIKLLYQIK